MQVYIYISPHLGGFWYPLNILGHVSQIPENTFSAKKKENDNYDQNW